MIKNPSVKKIVLFAIGVALYYVAGAIGLKLATLNNYFVSMIFPAAGVAIGLTYLAGYWIAPAFFVGSFILVYPTGTNITVALMIGLGAMIKAMVGRCILKRFISKNAFKDYSELISVILCAIVTCAISATISVSTLLQHGLVRPEFFFKTWYRWWSGDGIGVLMILPLILEISRKNFSGFTAKKISETIFIATIILAILYFCFMNDLNQAFLWLSGPALVFLGVRCGRINAAIVYLIVSCFVASLTVLGYGPFQYGNTTRNIVYIQTLIAGMGLCVLFIKHMKSRHLMKMSYLMGLLSCTGILFVITYFTTYYEKRNTLDDYNSQIESALNALEKITQQYALMMNGTSGAFRMSNNVEQEEWKSFVDSILPSSFFEPINGLGFIARVKKEDTEKHLKKFKLKLTEINPEFSSQYEDRYIITYIEPVMNNNEALGLDIGSEQRRREAADTARRLHRTVATDPIQLLQDKYKRKGFLIYHPTYSKQDEFIGWTYAPVISEIFFGKTLDYLKDSIKIKISEDNQELFSSVKDDPPFRQDAFYFSKDILIFGKVHRVEFYPTDQFFRRHSDFSVVIPLIINLFVLIIAALCIEQITFGLRAEALVAERTKELDASKMQLIESSKMASLGEMASGMAHEINNPLTIIQGKLQVIQMLLADLNVQDKAVFDELGKIRTTTNRIEKIVKGLRNFSRAANHDPFELTALKPIVTETLDLCAEKIRAEGINLIVSDIPQLSIRCRPAQLSQVLINLLNNSRDAIQDSTTKWIDLSFRTVQNKIQIIITDSGPGIPHTVAERMMEPFFTTKEVGKGTGLGLSISKGIINAHGGKLWLDTTSINTRFVIELRYYS